MSYYYEPYDKEKRKRILKQYGKLLKEHRPAQAQDIIKKEHQVPKSTLYFWIKEHEKNLKKRHSKSIKTH